MTPYYADDLVTLYHGDSREITSWLAADVLVTDPPYGMAYQSNLNRDRRSTKKGRPVVGDQDHRVRDEILALWGDRPALVFGRWSVPRPANVRHRLVWDKGDTVGMGDLSIPWGLTDEEIYVLGHGFTGKRESNVIRVQMLMSQDRRRPDHPTPKPVGLLERLVDKCPPGGTITVPCHYCGTAGAIHWHRNYDGSPSYWVTFGHELDHVDPEYHGGPTTVDNLVLACRPCNRSKGART